MRQHHTLWLAGGARGVKQSEQLIVFNLRGVGQRRMSRDQILINQIAWSRLVGHRDELFDGLELRADRFKRRRERSVDGDRARPRVIEDVFDLPGRDAKVDWD